MRSRLLQRLTVGLLVWIMVAGPAFSAPVMAVAVTINPTAVTLTVGGQRQFTARVTGIANTAVTWKVNNIVGGNSVLGKIDSTGKYTAPASTPPGWTVIVKAVSAANANAYAASTVTIRNQIPLVTSVVPKTLPPGPFNLTINGSRFAHGAQALWNGSPLVTSFVNSNHLTATGNATQAGTFSLRVANPGPGAVSTPLTVTVAATSNIVVYGRFLDQTSFGPTPQSLAHAQQVGLQAFLDEQFTMPESTWPALATASRSDVVDAFFANAATGQDQLRQRVIFALSEIIVVAMNKNTNGNEIVPWLQLLSRNSFGNYRTLLRELTLDASMGKYLDLANSGVSGGAPNENYPREVMQLFSIGLYKLNPDGSLQLDAANQPIPTYTQADVQQLARALTGWTYNSANGTTGSGGNWNYYPGPMIPVPGKHNASAKTFLGQTLPAGRTIQQDLDGAIDIIFHHPNVGPFVATRLIRALVTSNPSPAYIARVAAVFDDNGQGGRGDMEAVIRAIIMDQAARDDAPPASFGRLRTPAQHTVALVRALNLNVGAASQFAYLFYYMNEGMLDAPSVFGHYSPQYHIPKSSLYGPEFQIYSASDAVNRANFFYYLMSNPWPINPALQPFVNVAGNSTALINAVDNALLYGRMSPQLRTAITNALPAQYDNNARALTALYLTVMSGEYLTQH